MSQGPTLPNFTTPPGMVYIPELDVALMAAVDAAAAEEDIKRDKAVPVGNTGGL